MKNKKIIFTIILLLILQTIPINIYGYSTSDKIQNLQEEIDRIQADPNSEDYNKLPKLQQQIDALKKELEMGIEVDMTANYQVFNPGTRQTIEVNLKNNGGETLERNSLEVTQSPEAISFQNGFSPEIKLNDMFAGNSQTVKINVNVADDAKGGSFPITFKFKGTYRLTGSDYRDFEISKTFYIKINPSKKNDPKYTNYLPLEIKDIKHPAIIKKGQVGDLSFKVVNPNNDNLDSVKITVEPEEGMVNQSQGVFVVNNFPGKSSKTFSVKFFGKDDAQRKNYSIKISTEPNTSVGNEINKQTDKMSNEEVYKTLPPSSQYTGIFYDTPPKTDDKDEKYDGVKNPQVMLTNYTTDPTNVQPGSEFILSMDFLNTSSEKELKNVKISLTADDGAFITVGSSNSFYIDRLGRKQGFSKIMRMKAKPDAETKTYGITVDYAYEDMKGNAITAKDVISVPVVQKTDISIGDIQVPQHLMEGEPVSLSLNFYNLGKTPVSNLKFESSGNFQVDGGDSSYFVGTFEPGKSDNYQVNIIPPEDHHVTGNIKITYETISGDKQEINKAIDLDLQIEPAPPMPDDMGQNMPQPHSKKKIAIITISVIAAIVIIIVIIKKKRKKKKQKELEIDE